MNPLLDFSKEELSMIGLALDSVRQAVATSIEHGQTPPDGLVETLVSTMDKFQRVVEARSAIQDDFDSLVSESLADVETALSRVESDPDSPIIFE